MARATYTRADGSQMPGGLRLLDLGLRAPEPADRVIRGVAVRLLHSRLPHLVAHYPNHDFLIPSGDTMYSAVFLRGEYEPGCSNLLRRWLRRGDCAIDIGANHGWYSLLMAAAVGSEGAVVAIEPMPSMASAWRRNFALNPHLTADLREIALGDRTGTVEIHQFDGLPHGHASVATLGREDFQATQTPIDRLDAVLGRDVSPDFIKLDVEGSELAVLKGSEQLITGSRPPSWLIEVNHNTSHAMGYTPLSVCELLMEAHTYDLFRVTDSKVVPERRPVDAPHGSSWLFVSQHDRERLHRLTEQHAA